MSLRVEYKNDDEIERKKKHEWEKFARALCMLKKNIINKKHNWTEEENQWVKISKKNNANIKTKNAKKM